MGSILRPFSGQNGAMERHYFDANATTPPLPRVVRGGSPGHGRCLGQPHQHPPGGPGGPAPAGGGAAHRGRGPGGPAGPDRLLRQRHRGPAPARPGPAPGPGRPARAGVSRRAQRLPEPAGGLGRCAGCRAIPRAAPRWCRWPPATRPGSSTPCPNSRRVRIKDAAQAWGKVPVTLSDCDAAVFSGHKIGGPRGAAVLWMRPGLPWTAVMEGPQERRRRGGTEDLPAILGLAEAVRELPARLGRERGTGAPARRPGGRGAGPGPPTTR